MSDLQPDLDALVAAATGGGPTPEQTLDAEMAEALDAGDMPRFLRLQTRQVEMLAHGRVPLDRTPPARPAPPTAAAIEEAIASQRAAGHEAEVLELETAHRFALAREAGMDDAVKAALERGDVAAVLNMQTMLLSEIGAPDLPWASAPAPEPEDPAVTMQKALDRGDVRTMLALHTRALSQPTGAEGTEPTGE